MHRTITCQHNGDSYETTYDTEKYSFGVVWRYRDTPAARPTPHAFEELPLSLQNKLENQAINPK